MEQTVSTEAGKWLERVVEHQEKLEKLIRIFHPHHQDISIPWLIGEITAPAAEAMRQSVVQHMAREKYDVVVKFREAVNNKDISQITRLLDQAWWGVPESTSCWNVEGFSEAVDLLDSVPQE